MQMHERLALARKARGFERANHAAEAMGVKYPTYAAHENGTRNMSRANTARYAKFFGVTVPWLEHGIGDGPNASKAVSDMAGCEPSLTQHMKALHSDHVRLEQAVAVVEGAMLSAGLKPEYLGELRRLIQECLAEPLDPPVPEAEFASRRDMTKFALSQFLKQRDALATKE